MVKGEIITLGTAAAAIGGAYKFSEFLHKAKRIRDVGPANAVYVRIIGRVRSDLDEVRRLLSVREIHDILEANPEKSKWVYGVMRDVRGALENITPHTERVGGDVEEGRRIGIRHRLYWLVSESEKLENREKELVVAHSSLNEVLGYLTALEPTEERPRYKHKNESSRKETHIDIDIQREEVDEEEDEGPQKVTERVERETWVERDAAPRKVEERREIHIEREHDHHGRHEHHHEHHHGHPQAQYEERREVYIDERERGPRRYEERDVHIERRETREPRDAQYEAQYDERYEEYDRYERRPQRYEDRPPPPPERYPEDRRRQPEPLGRRPESFEDRLPERDTWMQSSAYNRARDERYGPYGEYAEYGAPQPSGAAHYQLPLERKYTDREMWIEQKEDYRYDEYGNKLPDRYFPPVVPRPYRSRM